MNLDDVSERIRFLKQDHTLAQFCNTIGIEYETVRKSLQRGGKLKDPETLSKIATHFGVDLHWLVTGNGDAAGWRDEWAKRFASLRKGKYRDLTKLRESISVEPFLLEAFESGAAAPSLECVERIARFFGASLHEFFAERQVPSAALPELKVFAPPNIQGYGAIRNEDFVSVPLTDSAIAAGQAIIPQENVEDYVLLHVRVAGKRKNLVASRVHGDSMEPVLQSGDIVVIDRDDLRLTRKKMFAVYHAGGLTAKYLERQNNLLILRPINMNSQIQVIDLNEVSDPVVGRIIGAWKEL